MQGRDGFLSRLKVGRGQPLDKGMGIMGGGVGGRRRRRYGVCCLWWDVGATYLGYLGQFQQERGGGCERQSQCLQY